MDDSKQQNLSGFLLSRYDLRFNVLTEMSEMTATDIYHVLQKRFPAVMRGVHPRNMGKIQIKIGAKRTHTKQGNLYEV